MQSAHVAAGPTLQQPFKKWQLSSFSTLMDTACLFENLPEECSLLGEATNVQKLWGGATGGGVQESLKLLEGATGVVQELLTPRPASIAATPGLSPFS